MICANLCGRGGHKMGRTPCLPQRIVVTRPLSQLSPAISCISEIFLILQETLLTNLAKSEICKKISRGRLRFFLQILYCNGFARSISCKTCPAGNTASVPARRFLPPIYAISARLALLHRFFKTFQQRGLVLHRFSAFPGNTARATHFVLNFLCNFRLRARIV